jgi:hypothetical protein
MAEHASQVSPFEGMPDELRSEFLETDHLIRLQPPRASGSVERRLV